MPDTEIMPGTELMKEYLRDAYMEGALDLGRDRKFLEGFLRIFAGEMEAVLAVRQAQYLTPAETMKMLAIAEPSPDSIRHLDAWTGRVRGIPPGSDTTRKRQG